MSDETELMRLSVENFKLRDKLLEICKECASCDGTGCANEVTFVRHGWRMVTRVHVVPCEACRDIREVLGQ